MMAPSRLWPGAGTYPVIRSTEIRLTSSILTLSEAMNLTNEQISDLCQAHCYRVIDNMNHDDLMSYAIQMMYQSFDKDPGQGNTDVEMLIQDIWVAEGEDDDSTSEFIAGVVGNDLAQEIMQTVQF